MGVCRCSRGAKTSKWFVLPIRDMVERCESPEMQVLRVSLLGQNYTREIFT